MKISIIVSPTPPDDVSPSDAWRAKADFRGVEFTGSNAEEVEHAVRGACLHAVAEWPKVPAEILFEREPVAPVERVGEVAGEPSLVSFMRMIVAKKPDEDDDFTVRWRGVLPMLGDMRWILDRIDRAVPQASAEPNPGALVDPKFTEHCPNCGSDMIAALRLRSDSGYERCRDCGAFHILGGGVSHGWDVPLKPKPNPERLREAEELLARVAETSALFRDPLEQDLAIWKRKYDARGGTA